MPQLDVSTFSSQLFWLAICWGMVFLYLWKFLVPKMTSKLAEREQKINSILVEAKNFDAQTEIMFRKYDEQLNRVKQQQQERLQQVSSFIQNSKEDLETDLKQSITAEIKKLEDELNASKHKILKQVPAELESVLAQFIQKQLPESADVDKTLKAMLTKELKKIESHD
jgi:F-type H+-transporting ATPase subunit b